MRSSAPSVLRVTPSLLAPNFVEITGVSGGGSLRLAIDVNATAIPDPVTSTSAPELSTWAMLLLGFAGLGFAGYRASRRTAEAALSLGRVRDLKSAAVRGVRPTDARKIPVRSPAITLVVSKNYELKVTKTK